MKLPTEFCRVVTDCQGNIAEWVCRGLGWSTDWLDKESFCVGFEWQGRLIGGLIYHQIRPKRDVWWTIYTTDRRWCQRRVLKQVFGLAFEMLQVQRISLLVNTDNDACLKLVEKLGFKREGLLRQYRDDGADCYLYGMLKSENKWR
jgi:RimJ/RimL family protein N-acetyltransferase